MASLISFWLTFGNLSSWAFTGVTLFITVLNSVTDPFGLILSLLSFFTYLSSTLDFYSSFGSLSPFASFLLTVAYFALRLAFMCSNLNSFFLNLSKGVKFNIYSSFAYTASIEFKSYLDISYSRSSRPLLSFRYSSALALICFNSRWALYLIFSTSRNFERSSFLLGDMNGDLNLCLGNWIFMHCVLLRVLTAMVDLMSAPYFWAISGRHVWKLHRRGLLAGCWNVPSEVSSFIIALSFQNMSYCSS